VYRKHWLHKAYKSKYQCLTANSRTKSKYSLQSQTNRQ